MINKNELIFAVDENNRPIEPVERHVAHAQGIWHRTTDIFVVNSKNEILCNERSMLKDTGPGLWDAAFGGHMAPGADAKTGAKIELEEESGLSVNENDLKFLGIVKRLAKQDKNKEFRYVFVYQWDGLAKDINFEKEEISQVAWFPIEKLQKELQDPGNGKWSPTPGIKLLFEYLRR